MSSLTDFLLARIAEREGAARAARRRAGRADDWADDWVTDVVPQLAGHAPIEAFRYLADISPARVLAECEAKRRIVETAADYVAEFGNESWRTDDSVTAGRVAGRAREWEAETLRLLALPYADHPDYDEEWKP